MASVGWRRLPRLGCGSDAELREDRTAPYCSPSNANVPPCAPPEGLPACNAFGDCGQLWCPGSGMNAVPGWDMNVCHTFHFDPNAPLTEPIMISGNPRVRQRLRRRRAYHSSTAYLG
jgi:hypothetical protein